MTLALTEQELELVRRAGLDPSAPDLLEALVERQAQHLRWLRQVEHQAPLATSVLWRAERAPCDQRRSVLSSLEAPTVSLVLGGNRSGKSVGQMQLTAAMLLGGDHPVVRAWGDLNELPVDRIPPGPGFVYAVAPSSADSLKYHRQQFDRLLGPVGKSWHNQLGKGEAVLRIEVPGHRVRGECWFKSVDQKRRSFQGASCRYIWIDEEPEGEEGKEVVEECIFRAADQAGRMGISMYPGDGLTWIHEDLVVGRKHDARVVELDALDNPHLPHEVFRALYRDMTEDEVARRRFGRFRARTGAIYPAWTLGDGQRMGPGHVCDPFEIPPDWPRYRGADFGLRVPTCVLWAALGDDDTLYVYREHYVAELTWEQHAQRCAELEEGEQVGAGWADPSGDEAIAVFGAHGVLLGLANRNRKAGIDEIRDRLRLHLDHRPRLKVFRTCVNLIREFPAYHWDPNRKDEEPVKKDDHALDALRYLAMGLRELGGY